GACGLRSFTEPAKLRISRCGMNAEPLIDTYYARTARSVKPFAALTGRISVDVCIVGGGLAGLSPAHELIQRGLKVALLERHRIAWGASGRNGGFVTAGYATGLDRFQPRLGKPHVRALFELSIEGVRIVRENIDRLGIEGTSPTPGVLRVTRYDAANE